MASASFSTVKVAVYSDDIELETEKTLDDLPISCSTDSIFLAGTGGCQRRLKHIEPEECLAQLDDYINRELTLFRPKVFSTYVDVLVLIAAQRSHYRRPCQQTGYLALRKSETVPGPAKRR